MTPRSAFINNANLEKVAAKSWDAMELASSHDPEHAKDIRDVLDVVRDLAKVVENVEIRVSVLERQMERIGAPQYRRVR